MEPRWTPGFDASAHPGPASPVVAFASGRLLVADAGGELGPLPLARLADALDGATPLHIGWLDGEPAFAIELGEADGTGLEPVGLREVLGRAPNALAAAVTRAAPTLEWELAHRFCSRCGTPTEAAAHELARRCPRCDASYYPRITPAVIMLVERDGEILLASRAGGTTGFYSCLAGFLEPGETLEQAVAREVREEVGVDVDGIAYFGSQPWPFPSQLMVAFTARYAGGELRVDPTELGDAAWFAPHALPRLPPPFTIARTLIDDACRRHG